MNSPEPTSRLGREVGLGGQQLAVGRLAAGARACSISQTCPHVETYTAPRPDRQKSQQHGDKWETSGRLLTGGALATAAGGALDGLVLDGLAVARALAGRSGHCV